MRSHWLSQSATPGRDALRLLLTRGLGLAVLIAVTVVVVSWPWQSLLVYLVLLALTVPAAVMETWTLRRTRRDPQRPQMGNPTTLPPTLRLVITLPPTDDHSPLGKADH